MKRPGSFGVVFVPIIEQLWLQTVFLFSSHTFNVLLKLHYHFSNASAGFVYVLMSPIDTSSRSMFSVNLRV